MLKVFKTLNAVVLVFGLGACQTVELVNDRNQAEGGVTDWGWNHMGIFGLVNYSDDFSAQSLCGKNGWKWVASDLSQGPLAAEIGIGVASNISATAGLGSVASFVYSPRTVSWQCGL